MARSLLFCIAPITGHFVVEVYTLHVLLRVRKKDIPTSEYTRNPNPQYHEIHETHETLLLKFPSEGIHHKEQTQKGAQVRE